MSLSNLSLLVFWADMADRQMRRVVFDTELDLMVILRDGVVFLDLNHERGNRPLAESVQGNFPEQNPRRGCRVLR